MQKWYVLTLLGTDQQGIVADVSQALYRVGCNLGEATMARLGDQFAIMLMVAYPGEAPGLSALLQPVTARLSLSLNVTAVAERTQARQLADVEVTVFGADRAGIVAQVTQALAQAGMNILDLRSEVAGSADAPIYVMHIEGQATRGVEALEAALEASEAQGIEVAINELDALIG